MFGILCTDKIRIYNGNGSLDGKFVYTGFKPAFVLLKRHTDSTNNWEIRDYKRVTNNPNNARIFPNANDVESVGEGIDFYNNGFKLRNSVLDLSNDKNYCFIFAEWINNSIWNSIKWRINKVCHSLKSHQQE